MESLSRPPPPQRRKHSTATNSFPLKSPYDDVFVARSGRLSPLEPHDYTEIFAGSSSAPPSIPVLDLSGLDDRAGSGDFRVSVQDYSSIFGGLRNDDVAVPYQELFGGFAKRAKPPRKSTGIKSPLQYSGPLHSSENTKTDGISVDIQSPLKHSGSLDPSESAKRPTGEASNQSVERGKQQINMSFNKTSQMNSDALNGEMHVAELHSVPGFTYFVDGTPQQQKAEDRKPLPRSLKREVSRTWSFSTDVKDGKHGSRIPDVPHNRTEGNRSSKKPPSSTSPEKPSDAKRTRASDFASKEDSSEKSWPPFLDEEFDENSVAAASAAALKKAIDQAQESIRIAKMIMGRKKEGHPDRYKTRSSDGGEDLDTETKIRHSAEYEETDITFSVDDKRVPSKAGNVGAKLFTSGCSKNVEICVGEKVEREEDVSRGPELFTSDGSQSEGDRSGEKAQLGTNVENAELAKELGEEFATGGWSFASLFRKGEKNIYVCEKVQLEMNGAAKGGHEGLARGAELVLSDCSSDEVCVREEVQPDNVESNEIDRETADFTGSEIVGRGDKTDASNSMHDPVDYVEETEQSKTSFCHAKASRDIFEPAVDTLQSTTQGKVMDDAENKTSVEDEVARMRKSEECDEMHNRENWTSLESEFINFTIEASHIIGRKLPEQEVTEKEAENIPRGEETEHSDEEEEVHLLFESKEPPEEVLEEEIDERERSASPETGEADKKIETCEPEIDTVRSRDHESDATPEHEAAESLMRQKNEVFCDVEETNSTFGETGRSTEDGSISDFQEVVYDDDINEAVDSNTPGASPVFSEAGYYPRTVNSNVENGTVPDVTEAENAEAEPSFHRETDELPAVDSLRCSASEEMSLEGEHHNTFEDPSDGKAENVIITDSKQNLSEDEHAFEAVDEIYCAEYAADDEEENFPSVITDAIPEQEQILERDQGSESTCSPDNVDRFSAHESEDDTENVEGETSSKEETAVEEQERLCEPKDDKFVEAKITAEKSSNVEKEDAEKDIENAERQQRIEAIKRAREQEKDRLVVERAIREARERAFAEARERAVRAAAEKAASEARITDTQKKLEKAPAVKHPSDKAAASTEAKLRAERAAVERATVEARKRALEKALSQKTPAEPRSDRNSVLKHSFSSSDLDSTYTESARRRQARLERHQRIMERAAKALAEKNMRDILAQKEQAERNRLAESLDVEIKRWATGKEGNLRALLSTLQYILGRDSSWQPISLTEIVTTAAVKKAYRKATLYVHPDKLQQRGASIQQKYICEKVFDLLKAAWNKFNSEER